MYMVKCSCYNSSIFFSKDLGEVALKDIAESSRAISITHGFMVYNAAFVVKEEQMLALAAILKEQYDNLSTLYWYDSETPLSGYS